MNYGSVCSGIEAATAAWEPLGWRPSFFAEIDKFPSAVLKHHYPKVPNYGDFTAIQSSNPIDVLVGGTPCQDFSIAGLRAGMAGERGNLTLEFLRLTDRLRPRWVVWENVPGVLSSNGGRDFGSFLGGLGELGYGFAYRTLDAQYFGVPQRRRRVFVVGHLGDWRRAAAVLFERHSLSGHPPPRRETGQSATYDVAPCLGASGRGFERTCDTRGQDCLIASTGEISHCLNGGGMGRQDFETETLLAVGGFFDQANPLAASAGKRGYGVEENYIALQAGCLRENPDSGPDGVGVRTDGIAYTLEARAEVQAVAFVQNSRDEVRLFGEDGQTVGALAAEPGMKQQSYLAIGWSEELTASIELAGTVQRGGQGGRHEGVMTPHMAVRRLTPRECERLQGFPDDYTLIGPKTADGPRYKALGNSMAVPVMRWIGERIQAVEDMSPE